MLFPKHRLDKGEVYSALLPTILVFSLSRISHISTPQLSSLVPSYALPLLTLQPYFSIRSTKSRSLSRKWLPAASNDNLNEPRFLSPPVSVINTYCSIGHFPSLTVFNFSGIASTS